MLYCIQLVVSLEIGHLAFAAFLAPAYVVPNQFVYASLYPSLKLHKLLRLSHAVHSAAVQDQFDTSLIVTYVLHTSLHVLSSQLHIKEVSMLEYGYKHAW